MIKEFSIPQLSTEQYKIDLEKSGQHKLFIHDNHLIYSCFSNGSWMDEDLGMRVDKHFNNTICLRKDRIACIELYYQNSENSWNVDITIAGGNRLICISFKEKQKAATFNDELTLWYTHQ